MFSYEPLSHEWASVGRPVRIYQPQLCTDTGCSLEDLPEAMDDRDKWWERVREIHGSGTTWYIYIYIYVCVCIYIYIYIYIKDF